MNFDDESKYMKVYCRSERSGNSEQVVVGMLYYIDRKSIWMDAEGDSYGVVYDATGKQVGQMLLSHFTSY